MTEDLNIQYFMNEAIIEGRKALPQCLPNPPVGCVIVQNRQIIARGYTQKPGKDHAEAMALRVLSLEEENLILFVTLEPCSFFGRTPSCAKLIAKRNVQCVYVGMLDPHPKNQGAGIKILQNAGIEVKIGALSEQIGVDLQPYLALDAKD